MNRRDFIRNLAVGAAVAGPFAIIGCGRQSGLLRDPSPPIFGSPRAGRQPALEPLEPIRREPLPGPAAVAPPQTGTVWCPHTQERPWQFIVLHHSATAQGSAAEFDRLHRALGWDELGYHFVIDNGLGAPNGLIEIGSRWVKQKHGAHCKVEGHPEYNDFGVGICLVGDFDRTRPTEAQVASAARLVRFVKDRYSIPASHIYGHKQLKPTHCPGYNFPYGDIYTRIA